MAEKASIHESAGGGVHVVTWKSLANTDTGKVIELSSLPDKTVQVTGTFGAGGSVSLQGSNDNTNWSTLNDPLGNAITMTAAGIQVILENPRYIRPSVTSGDGTTDLTVTLVGVDPNE